MMTSQLEEIISYNDLMNSLESEEDHGENNVWKFWHITAHQGPLMPHD
jgi:hypothetical protein